MKDFLRIYRAKYWQEELGEDVRLWLELLEFVVFVSYRHADLYTSRRSAESQESQTIERRQYWLSARKCTLKVTDQEHDIYKAWNRLYARSLPATGKKLRHPSSTLSGISPLFFTISAKIASCIDQGISQQWMDLAAEFMLQTALESRLMPGGRWSGGNLPALSFAWGWIPSTFWDGFKSGDRNIEAELLINQMFEDDDGNGPGENVLWHKTRLKYMSLISSEQSKERQSDDALATQLQAVANKYPMEEFEKKVVAFSKGMWEFCRKPTLVQIEDGEFDGMTNREFEGFKKSIFVPL